MPVVNPYARRQSRPGAPGGPTGASNAWAAGTAPHGGGGGGGAPLQSSTGDAPPPLPAAFASLPTPRSAACIATTFSQAFGTAADGDGGDGGGGAASESIPAATGAAEPPLPSAGGGGAQAASDRDCHALLGAHPHALHVSHRQRGNGVLRFLRNVPWSHSRMVPDYVWGTTRCALYLSLKYHALHPHYLSSRIAELGKDFATRILLALVDVPDSASLLLQLNVAAVRHDFTLVLAWSEEEAARYLETYKALEGRDATPIQRQLKATFCEQAVDFLTGAGTVHKSDAAQLLGQFGSLRSLVAATPDELGLVPGMGPVKVRKLHAAFHKPFSSRASALRRAKKQRQRAAATDDEPDAKDAAAAPAATHPAPADDDGNRKEEDVPTEDAEGEVTTTAFSAGAAPRTDSALESRDGAASSAAKSES